MKIAVVILLILAILPGCMGFGLSVNDRPILGAERTGERPIVIVTLIASAVLLGVVIAGGS